MTRDWPLKLLAVALAIVVWLTVVGQEQYLWEMTVPLEILNLPSDLTFVDEEVPRQVTVRVRGARAVLEGMKAGDVDAKVDLSDAKPGGNFIQLGPGDVRVPFGVELVSVSPPSIRLAVQPKLVKMVPVIPAVRGQLPEGYELSGVSVTPKEVEVEGPEEDVKAAIEVTTEVVYLSGRTGSFSEQVRIDPKTTRLRLRNGGPAKVEILIAEQMLERTFAGVPVSLRQGQAALIDPARVTVTVSGPASVINRIGAANLAAYVDLGKPGDLPGPFALAPTVELEPADLRGRISIKRIEPSEVQVKLQPGRSRQADAAAASLATAPRTQ